MANSGFTDSFDIWTEGALAWLVCCLDSELRRGDHVVAIGQVLGGAVDESASPLLFYRASYLSLPTEEPAVHVS